MKIGYDLTAARINTAGTGMYVKGLFNELRHTLRPDESIPFAFGPTIPAVQQRPIRRKINTLMRDVWWMGLELADLRKTITSRSLAYAGVRCASTIPSAIRGYDS